MGDAYLWNRRRYADISGNLAVAAATDDTTLASGKTSETIFIQRIVFVVTTDAAQSMSFEDSNVTPKQIANIPASPGVGTPWNFDYGPNGVPLTEAKDFVMNVSAPGLAGQLVWYGYRKQTAVTHV